MKAIQESIKKLWANIPAPIKSMFSVLILLLFGLGLYKLYKFLQPRFNDWFNTGDKTNTEYNGQQSGIAHEAQINPTQLTLSKADLKDIAYTIELALQKYLGFDGDDLNTIFSQLARAKTDSDLHAIVSEFKTRDVATGITSSDALTLPAALRTRPYDIVTNINKALRSRKFTFQF